MWFLLRRMLSNIGSHDWGGGRWQFSTCTVPPSLNFSLLIQLNFAQQIALSLKTPQIIHTYTASINAHTLCPHMCDSIFLSGDSFQGRGGAMIGWATPTSLTNLQGGIECYQGTGRGREREREGGGEGGGEGEANGGRESCTCEAPWGSPSGFSKLVSHMISPFWLLTDYKM